MTTKAETIERLRELVRVVKAAPEGKFDMSDWERKHRCGTVRCAAGWACVDPWFNERGLRLHRQESYSQVAPPEPMYRTWFGVEALAQFFGITYDVADMIFMPWEYREAVRTSEDRWAITREQVVAQIEKIIRDVERRRGA